MPNQRRVAEPVVPLVVQLAGHTQVLPCPVAVAVFVVAAGAGR